MKTALALFGLGLVAVVVQGALGRLIAPPWCPDFALLVLIGIGLRWRGLAAGLVLAALLGYATDLLSGSLFGQRALLNLFVFSGTLLATQHLNLRGSWPLAWFATSATLAYGLAMLAITGFFIGGAELRWAWLGAEMIHAGFCGLVAPTVAAGVAAVSGWASDEDTSGRAFGIPSGRPA